MVSFKLVWRNLMRRKLRTALTVASLALAIFLICLLRTLITTLSAGADAADNRRLAVMSANGLFVELPMKYQHDLDPIDGIELTTKFQWFGGYFRSPKNFFAQFAVDAEAMLEMYPECVVPADQREAFLSKRTSCLIGDGLAEAYGWKVGDKVPIIGSLHPHPDDVAWDFEVAAIYHSAVPNFDNRTLFFHWEYFEETLKRGSVPPSVGVFSARVEQGADVARVIAAVEDKFRDSDQRVQCVTEAEFQRQFVSMVGNVPLFVGWIGFGVLFAIVLATINTMLMAMREQTVEIGILKALGFNDGAVFGLLAAQGMLLCLVGGALGMGAAWITQASLAAMLGAFFPGFVVTPATFAIAAVVTVGLGLFAGIFPAVRAARLRVVEAIRGE